MVASLLLSPNVLPWYALWLLPLLVVRDEPAALLFTGTVSLAYLVYPAWQSGEPWKLGWGWRALEYLPCPAGGGPVRGARDSRLSIRVTASAGSIALRIPSRVQGRFSLHEATRGGVDSSESAARDEAPHAPAGASESYRVGDLLVDVTGASVSRHGERIVLPPRTFELLVALVRRYPCTVRRHDLLETVWPDEIVSDQTLSHRVMVLRKALGDHAEEPAYVAGERGFGYRWLAPVDRVCAGELDGRAPPDASLGARRTRRARIGVAATIVVAVVGIALAGVALIPGHKPEPQAPVWPPGASPQARLDRLCLRGEFFFLTFSEAGLRRSADAWEQAATLAPESARAHAGRALTGAVRALLDDLPPAEAERLTRGGARRALELDPECPAAHLAQSLKLLLFDWAAAGAAAEARRAVSADRNDARGPIVLALALQGQGRVEESQRLLEAASLDDPHSAASSYLEARAHQIGGPLGRGDRRLHPGLGARRPTSCRRSAAGRSPCRRWGGRDGRSQSWAWSSRARMLPTGTWRPRGKGSAWTAAPALRACAPVSWAATSSERSGCSGRPSPPAGPSWCSRPTSRCCSRCARNLSCAPCACGCSSSVRLDLYPIRYRSAGMPLAGAWMKLR